MKLIDITRAREPEETRGASHVGEGGGDDDGGDGKGERKVVVVGVKLDQQSRELLTWALLKVARSGDLVIALHVLSASNEVQSTLVALVNTFDSLLSAYEGFCRLREVDLKLKVLRGSCARKHLVQEAKRHQIATVIIGTSTRRHMVRSSLSVAKYCARKLPNDFSVAAVDKGKTVFSREATTSRSPSADSQRILLGEAVEGLSRKLGKRSSWKIGSITKYFGCASRSSWKDHSGTQFQEEPDRDDDGRKDSPSDLVAFEKPELMSIAQEQGEFKQGGTLLRRANLPEQGVTHNASSTKTSPVCQVQRHSSNVIRLDEDHGGGLVGEDQTFSCLNEENSEIVPFRGSAESTPHSPKRRSLFLLEELEGLHEKYSSTCRLYSYQELVTATSNFDPERMIGKGGSSQVFRGSFPGGQEVAVKILKPSEDAFREFTAEVDIITRICHKNIISLFGYCFEYRNLILVYNYLARGSLEEILQGSENVTLGWAERHKVAVGVAEALLHLHNGSSQPVIHRDVKSSNILLSKDFEPQLADFGLASWASNDSSYKVYDDVAGTFGYLAPEYFMHGKATVKIDVYAYGVVLLELLTGKEPIDHGNPECPKSLVAWATPILQDRKRPQLLDSRMGNHYDHDEVERMVLAAMLCIRRAPKFRPGISIILKLLQGDIEVTTWAKQQVDGGTSSVVDRDPLDCKRYSSDIQSFLNTALLDIEDESLFSSGSPGQNISFEEYLKGRWSRSPSFPRLAVG